MHVVLRWSLEVEDGRKRKGRDRERERGANRAAVGRLEITEGRSR